MANFLRLGELLKKQQGPAGPADEKEKQKANQETQVATSSREANQSSNQQKPSQKQPAEKKAPDAQPKKQVDPSTAGPAEPRHDKEAGEEPTSAEQRADRPSAARIVAYSDSDSDEEPLVKRRKAREKAEAAARSGEEGPESGSGLAPLGARQGLAAIGQQKIVQVKQQAATGARRMRNGINLDLLMKVCPHAVMSAESHFSMLWKLPVCTLYDL